MEIYVRVQEDGCGQTAWYNEEDNESFLMDGKDLFCIDDYHGDYPRGTAFNTVKKAKTAGRYAKCLMEDEGVLGKVKVTYWRFIRNELVETKFTKDDKIKK